MSGETFLSAYLVYQLLTNSRYPVTKQKIRDHLEDAGAESLSERSMDRLIAFMREEFSFIIRYDKIRGGYVLEHEQDVDYTDVMEKFKLLERVAHGRREDRLLKRIAGKSRYIRLDAPRLARGQEYLDDLLEAASNNQVVKVTYRTYQEADRTRVHELEPHVLLERDHRWYVLGHSRTAKGRRILALDRIESIEVISDLACEVPWQDHREDLSTHVGTHLTEAPPIELILKVTAIVGRLLESLPLHESQQVLDRGGDYWRVAYWVVPNYDLKMRIVGLGKDALVESPGAFRQEIADYIGEMQAHYQSAAEKVTS